jgi:hypothetical protein
LRDGSFGSVRESESSITAFLVLPDITERAIDLVRLKREGEEFLTRSDEHAM